MAEQNITLTDLQKMLGDMGSSYVNQQKAGLDSNLSNQITQLKTTYDQAIADGNMSIRDAESAFENDKKTIEKQAYVDSEKTAVYGNNMGIQNSQQMVGLMQGDQARANARIDTATANKNQRIASIKDRLNAIGKEKDLAIANAQSQYNAGLLKAQGDAGMMVNQNMFNYASNLGQMQEQSRLRIHEMGIQNQYDMAKMAQSMQNEIKLAGIKMDKELEMMTKKAALDIENEKKAYDLMTDRALAKVTPGTREYQIIQGQRAQGWEDYLVKKHAETVYEATAKSVFNNPDLANPPKTPTDYAKTFFGDYWGGINNWLWGKDLELKKYGEQQNPYQEALKRKQDFMNNPSSVIPNPFANNSDVQGGQYDASGNWFDYSKLWTD